MLRFALAIFVLCVASIPGYCNDIKLFMQYQKERLRTYNDALEQHAKTKCVVAVWVGVKDDDNAFQQWLVTRDLAYHVFVDKFDNTPLPCIIVARDDGGKFCWFGAIVPPSMSSLANSALTHSLLSAKDNPPVSGCANGQCPLTSSCPNGNCSNTNTRIFRWR